MARLPRIVLPNTPHHVTQRGNGRQQVFFGDDDYASYLKLLTAFTQKAGTRVLAYYLMPNHVHFVLVPTDRDGLRSALGEAHRRYTRYINFRERWRGHLWQERFHSFPMDEAHLWMAIRYIELNPVKAGLVDSPAEWRWSSAAAHLEGRAEPLVDLAATSDITDDWSSYLESGLPNADSALVEQHLRTGRPLGDDRFIDKAEQALGRSLQKQRPGPKPKDVPGRS